MATLRHIFSLAQLPSPLTQSYPRQRRQDHSPLLEAKPSRRESIFLFSSFLSLSKTADATAFSIGIPGPKELLRDQKRRTSKYLLAPIDASRESLLSASALLKTATPGSSKDIGEEIQRILKSAARDCVVQDRNSFVAFQAQTGVEVCTFSLIFKNASSLLDDKNPTKLEAQATLGDLLRSFNYLNFVMINSDLQVASDRQKVEDLLTDTISHLERFEQGIKKCLDV